jgi:hypothetical protein
VSDQSHDRRDRMTVTEASKILGISEGAVRKRVERGKLAHDRAPDGRLIVYLDATATTRDRVRDESQDATTERYVRGLEDQVEYLRSQLDQERDANRENRRIIAALTSRIPELPAGTPPDERESPVTAADEQQGRGPPVPDAGGPREEGTERPWWRRVFGS